MKTGPTPHDDTTFGWDVHPFDLDKDASQVPEADNSPSPYYPDANGNFAWDSPCWNDEWEHEFREAGYRTTAEWEVVGRSVTVDQKGRYLPCAKITVFNKSQTRTNEPHFKKANGQFRFFYTFTEAAAWARENPGKAITRSPDGRGFVSK